MERLFRPVDAASLAVFRVLFGMLLFVAMLRYFAYGWIDEFYVAPLFYFSYAGLEWLQPLPAPWMFALFATLAVCALCIALGFHYRLAAAAFTLGFSYVHLLDKTNYLNHYYLISWLALLLVLLPLHRTWSIDAWRTTPPQSPVVPVWMLGLLRFQIVVVYFFAGLAKIDRDWLLHAQPLRIWLAASGDVPVLGPWLEMPWVAYAFSWAGMLFDLGVPWLLLWGRTRTVAYAAVIVFHLLTGMLFPIGLFPLVMVVLTTIFFAPRWPRRFIAGSQPAYTAAVPRSGRPSRLVVAGLGIYAAVQLLLPLRFLAYPGCVNWTEDGFRFAWRVMLIEKYAEASFRLVDRSSGRSTTIEPTAYLTPKQERMMSTQPDMILQFAHWLGHRYDGDVAVFADVRLTYNGRPSQVYVDPQQDLLQIAPATPAYLWLSTPCPLRAQISG